MELVKYKYRTHGTSGKIFHGEIFLKSSLKKEGQGVVNIKFDLEYAYGGKWKNAVCFGIDYFANFLFSKNSENIDLDVEVVDIGWFPIDTRHTVMVYVTIMALCQKYNMKIENLDFNPETGILTLPIIKE